MSTFSIAIHGGAGTILRSQMTPEKEAKYLAALKAAVDAGYAILERGGSSLDAVEAAIISLEDCPLFNAGKGAVFNNEGRHEMDASIMYGKDLSAGAVAVTRSDGEVSARIPRWQRRRDICARTKHHLRR
jgi:beta-aspartyl-peptidase (threonine type)